MAGYFCRAGWGVCAQWRGDSERGDLINLNADTFFTPASNTKLHTVAAAQSRLGLEATLSTELWLSPAGASGIPTLTLKGSGDPTLTFADLQNAAAAIGPQLGGGAAAVDITVDVGVFGRSAIPDAWDWDYVSTTSGVIPSSVVVDRNTMRLTVTATSTGAPAQLEWEHPAADEAVEVDNVVEVVGSASDAAAAPDAVHVEYRIAGGSGSVLLVVSGRVTVGAEPVVAAVPTLRPDRRAGLLLAESLGAVGVGVGSVRVSTSALGAEPETAQLLHSIQSAPMQDILRDTMQPSDNLYAECLLRLLAPHPASAVSSGASISAAQVLQENRFSCHFYRLQKMHHLPRQAWDKYRKISQKRDRLLAGRAFTSNRGGRC